MGEFARFVKGPGIGAQASAKLPLGKLLQSHIAIVRSLGKVDLPGLLYPDVEIECELAADEKGKSREPVTTTLRQILMKRKIGKIHTWQCIVPRHGGGWEGYYVNGKGCAEHRVEAIIWASCLSSHLRFHLLKRGVEAGSMEDFVNLTFTLSAAMEAFAA